MSDEAALQRRNERLELAPQDSIPFLEAVVSLDPQIVDLGLAHNLQKKVPACPQTGIDDVRQCLGPKNVVAQLVEEVRSAAKKRERVDRGTAVMELSAHLHDHPLVDVEPGLGDLLPHSGRFARIDEAQPAGGS